MPDSPTEQFNRIYEDNFSRVYNYVYFRVRNHDLAQDLTADTFVRAFKYYEGYDKAKAGEYTWLCAIARNVVIRHFKTHKEMSDIDDFALTLAGASDTEGEAIDHSLRSLIMDEVRQLPIKKRQLIEMKYFMQMKNTEIASVLEISADLVGVMLHRTINELRSQMEIDE
jgi:RNA polymerase sigma-70 factor (ECF subfamily)